MVMPAFTLPNAKKLHPGAFAVQSCDFCLQVQMTLYSSHILNVLRCDGGVPLRVADELLDFRDYLRHPGRTLFLLPEASGGADFQAFVAVGRWQLPSTKV